MKIISKLKTLYLDYTENRAYYFNKQAIYKDA